MDPTALDLPRLDVNTLLRQYNLTPKKGLGQNFLDDPEALKQVTLAAKIPPDATVLEVGPGLGHLTRYLLQSARLVIAVELDRGLMPVLTNVLAAWPNLTLVQGDILELDPAKLMGAEPYLVVANIPYYITSALIRHLLESDRQPLRLVLTVQKEVAERICALPGDLSLLALSVQVYGKASIAGSIPAEAFYPAPKVDSAIVCVEIFQQPLIPAPQLDAFFHLVKAGFSQKRKTLRNAMSAGLHLPTTDVEALLNAVGIDPRRRAETLSLPEWQVLTDAYTQRRNQN
jgi:16S rRNA (adenine1518-N6/adenine1519-N6)-dimethyltransferase